MTNDNINPITISDDLHDLLKLCRAAELAVIGLGHVCGLDEETVPIVALQQKMQDRLDIIMRQLVRDDDGDGDVEPAAGDVGSADADDTRLIGLGKRLCIAMMHEKAAGDDDVSQDEHEAAITLCREIAKEISVAHATTLAGLRAKALAVEWIYEDDGMDKRPAIETLIAGVRAVVAAA